MKMGSDIEAKQKGQGLGRFLLIFGILLAVFGIFSVQGYDSTKSFVWNAQHRSLELPFFRGDKPLSCLADSFRRLLPNPTGAPYKPEPGCNRPTQVMLASILFTSLLSILLGLYLLFKDVQIGGRKDAPPVSKKDDDKGGSGDKSGPKQKIDTSANNGGG